MLPHPDISKIYFKLFGFPDIASHVRFPIIINLCDPKRSDLILDVGCGLGVYSNTIAMKTGAKCIGIDLNVENLRKANLISNALKLNSKFHFMNATKIQFPSESFDKVLCIEVLEHIKDDNQVLAEIARVLKPGGTLVLSTPIKTMSDEEERIVFAHPKLFQEARTGYELRSLEAKIQKMGLKILKVKHWYRWFTKQALKVMDLLHYRQRLKSIVAIYPFLIPLGLLDRVHQQVTHEKGWYRCHIILASKSA